MPTAAHISTPPGSPSLWTIADIERETGLHKDTLRVWERRYGFPQPGRNAHGDRVYDETQLRRLLLVRRLMDAGARAGQVVPLAEADLLRRLEACSGSALPGEPQQPDTLSPWVGHLRQNAPHALRAALQEHLLRHGLSHTIEHLLGPLSQRVGEEWHNGSLSVFQEHLYSEVAHSLLREALHTLATTSASTQPPRVLLTTLPGEQHTLGLLMAECLLALEHCERIALGANTPLADITTAVAHYRADLLALSVSAHAPPREVQQHLAQLRASLPAHVPIWIGGRFTQQGKRRLAQGVHIVDNHADLHQAVANWRAAHRPTPSTP